MLANTIIRILKGSIWGFISSFFIRFAGLITGIVISRTLGENDFGTYSMVLLTTGTFASISAAGAGSAAARYISEHRTSSPDMAASVLYSIRCFSFAAAFLFAAGVLIFSRSIASSVFNTPDISTIFAMSSMWIFLTVLTSEQNGVLTGFEAFRQTSAINAAYAAFAIISSAIAAVLYGLKGVIFANTFSTACLYMMNSAVIRSQCILHHISEHREGRKFVSNVVFGCSLPAFLSSVIVYPANWLCASIIAHQNNGAVEVGIYNISCQWRNVAMYIPTTISAVFVSVVSNTMANIGTSDRMRLYKSNLALNILSSLAITIPLIYFADTLMGWYGKEFVTGSNALSAMVISGCLLSAMTVAGQALLINELIWPWFWLNLIWAVILVGLSWLLRHLGAYGISIANIAAFLLHFINILLYMYFHFKISQKSSKMS